jgi:pyridoxal phosphate enzyme (YggS family)
MDGIKKQDHPVLRVSSTLNGRTATMIAENIQRIMKSMPAPVTVLAAAKTRSVQMVQEAYQAGIRHVGHNYVQEAAAMIPAVPEAICWHMIGHLQRNKSRQALGLFDMIDSIDSQRLADELEKQAASLGRNVPVMIEVNIGEEEAKSGVQPDRAFQLAQYIRGLSRLKLVGIMTMGPLSGDPENSRAYFKRTARIYEEIKRIQPDMEYLSMGMSHDYRVAVEEGATLVRLGTAIFGERPTKN